jgi:molybdopterin converting factor subunit 1
MTVRIRLFARLRDIVGAAELEREAPDGATAGTVWAGLASEYPELDRYARVSSCAVNEEYAPLSTILQHGDEVAFLPPVSGGAPRSRNTHHDR